MKIGYAGLELPEGKVKYDDPVMLRIVDKCKPKKVSPFYVELIPNEFVQAEAIVLTAESILDLLIFDMEKCETRIERSEDEAEKTLMKKCLALLEEETPLCNVDFSEEEWTTLQASAMLSIKPVLVVDEDANLNDIIGEALEKADIVFFYTADSKEVHAWDIKKGSELVECAGRIHSDLSRGFIKADVVTADDFIESHNFNDAKKRGVVKVVNRDHPISPGDIVEIRFNV